MTKKFLHKTIDPKNFTHKAAARAERFWIVVHTDEGGYIEEDFTVHVWDDGSFTISDNNGKSFISVNGEAAKAISAYLTQNP